MVQIYFHFGYHRLIRGSNKTIPWDTLCLNMCRKRLFPRLTLQLGKQIYDTILSKFAYLLSEIRVNILHLLIS